MSQVGSRRRKARLASYQQARITLMLFGHTNWRDLKNPNKSDLLRIKEVLKIVTSQS